MPACVCGYLNRFNTHTHTRTHIMCVCATLSAAHKKATSNPTSRGKSKKEITPQTRTYTHLQKPTNTYTAHSTYSHTCWEVQKNLPTVSTSWGRRFRYAKSKVVTPLASFGSPSSKRHQKWQNWNWNCQFVCAGVLHATNSHTHTHLHHIYSTYTCTIGCI